MSNLRPATHIHHMLNNHRVSTDSMWNWKEVHLSYSCCFTLRTPATVNTTEKMWEENSHHQNRFLESVLTVNVYSCKTDVDLRSRFLSESRTKTLVPNCCTLKKMQSEVFIENMK